MLLVIETHKTSSSPLTVAIISLRAPHSTIISIPFSSFPPHPPDLDWVVGVFSIDFWIWAFWVRDHYLECISPRVRNQLKRLSLNLHLFSPIHGHGARIVENIVGDRTLFNEWKEEMESMVGRIKNVRKKLFDNLSQKDESGKEFSFVLRQNGMFSCMGLNKAQCDNLTNKWNIYVTKDRRITMAGLSLAKCEYLADAIIDSCHNDEDGDLLPSLFRPFC